MKKKRMFLIILLITSLLLPYISVQAIDSDYKVVTEKKKYLVKSDEENYLLNKARMSSFQPDKFKEVTKEFDYLVKKTKAEYEVILAKGNKTYSYVDKANSYEEAVEKADRLREGNDDLSITPSVIDRDGVITYATEQIGRVWKEYESGYTGTKSSLSMVYSDSELRNEYTYINDGYISEVPIIEKREREAKVLVAGYEGWMNIDKTRNGNSDLRVVPITDVQYSCYYFVESGILKQRITTSISSPPKTTTMIGVAPSYLKEGKKYLSYDSNYFYDGTNIHTGLINLTRDLQSGTKSLSVNKDEPYYAYYKYLPFRTKTNYTADEINKFIADNTISSSKLRGMGQAFIEAQNKYGVNALLALGVAINESGWGTSQMAMEKNNLFGLKAYDDSVTSASGFKKPEDSILDFSRGYISKGYSDPNDWRYYGGFLGDKYVGVNVKYASDPYWSVKGSGYAFQADYEMSGKDMSKSKDYNNYQLVMYTGANKVVNKSGQLLYNIASAPRVANQSHVGSVAALVSGNKKIINGVSSYEIYPERTTPVTNGVFAGEYDWNTYGYVKDSNIRLMNKGKTGYIDEDINMDGVVDAKDVAKVADSYNKLRGESGWVERCDINKDGIVDIFDIVKVSRKL
ncbi:glucosaminidase domain-containing protein [Clostridium paraputrificum]|uniref:glucosaminidase domain-containing protein n=1 Tax=Clostridium paraputrificum TaxID=29363 RepID=UPI003D33E45C